REQKLEALVGDCRLVHGVLNVFRHIDLADLHGKGAIAPDSVDGPVPCRGHEPGAWVGGRPISGPALGGDRERLLGGFLGELEVAEEADQRGEDAAPFVAEYLLDGRYRDASRMGRTSTAPPMRAAGMRDASSIAASRSSASNRSQPPSASLIATNGPS